MISKLFFTGALCSVISISSAQVLSDTSHISMPEIIVEGMRLSDTLSNLNTDVQVITRKQIESLPVQSVNELLMTISGVDMRRRGPAGVQGDLTIDGSTFDQVLVLINGVKMSDPQTGHHMMNIPVPLESIDHIEIIRGASGRSYGVNALAGVINIITKIPQKDMAFAEVHAGSSFDKDTLSGDTYYNFGMQAGAAFRKDKAAHMLALTYDKGNGYRYNTGFENYKAFYQNQLVLKEHELEMMGAFIHNDFGANAFYAAPGDVNSKETVQTAVASLKDSWHVNNKLTISPRFSFRYGNDHYFYNQYTPEKYVNQHETNVVNAAVNGSYISGHHSLGAGVEWRNENIRSSNLGFHTRDNLGLFLEYKYSLRRFSAGAGLYGNINSDWGFELFPGADLGYAITKDLKIFANVGTGQRLPTYTDLYYDGPSNKGNPFLEPETGLSTEGGIKYHKSVLELDASLSFKNINDFIDYTRVNINDEWQPNNFQNIKTTVYNFRFAYFAGKHLGWTKTNLNIRSSYTYTEPDVESDAKLESKYAIESLRHQWLSSLEIATAKLSFQATARYLFRINGNDYTVLDSRISYTIGKFKVFADVSNILDTQYSEIAAVPLPGKWFGIGIHIKI